MLINPKTPANVGGVLRACSLMGVNDLVWTGERVMDTGDMLRKTGTSLPNKASKYRLPREERMRDYQNVHWHRDNEKRIDTFVRYGYTPVAVENRMESELLPFFQHPDNPLYIFGPEDGSIPKGVLTVSHRFVRIPSSTERGCFNLSAAVNVVLYDRLCKNMMASYAIG